MKSRTNYRDSLFMWECAGNKARRTDCRGRKVLEWRPEIGKRSVGYPPTTWRNHLAKATGSRWIQPVSNRDNWSYKGSLCSAMNVLQLLWWYWESFDCQSRLIYMYSRYYVHHSHACQRILNIRGIKYVSSNQSSGQYFPRAISPVRRERSTQNWKSRVNLNRKLKEWNISSRML